MSRGLSCKHGCCEGELLPITIRRRPMFPPRPDTAESLFVSCWDTLELAAIEPPL